MTNLTGVSTGNACASVFLFVGPSGVGKTELARALAEQVFGNEHAMLRVDMGSFKASGDISTLVGAPKGYQDSKEGGSLTNFLARTRPRREGSRGGGGSSGSEEGAGGGGVVLLDEVEIFCTPLCKIPRRKVYRVYLTGMQVEKAPPAFPVKGYTLPYTIPYLIYPFGASERFPLIPLQYWLLRPFTPELQWQSRGQRRISQGWVSTGNRWRRHTPKC